MKHFTAAAVERALKVQEVILRALAGTLTWIPAAEIIGVSARQMRRWYERYREFGYDGLYDRRRGKPSPRRVSIETVHSPLMGSQFPIRCQRNADNLYVDLH